MESDTCEMETLNIPLRISDFLGILFYIYKLRLFIFDVKINYKVYFIGVL